MNIGESYKISINKVFKNTIFKGRGHKDILETLATKVHGSDNVTIIPPFQFLKVEAVDDTHDSVSIIFDDYSIDGIITWIPIPNGFVFVKYI
jgi:hypothetical protein